MSVISYKTLIISFDEFSLSSIVSMILGVKESGLLVFEVLSKISKHQFV